MNHPIWYSLVTSYTLRKILSSTLRRIPHTAISKVRKETKKEKARKGKMKTLRTPKCYVPLLPGSTYEYLSQWNKQIVRSAVEYLFKLFCAFISRAHKDPNKVALGLSWMQKKRVVYETLVSLEWYVCATRNSEVLVIVSIFHFLSTGIL